MTNGAPPQWSVMHGQLMGNGKEMRAGGGTGTTAGTSERGKATAHAAACFIPPTAPTLPHTSSTLPGTSQYLRGTSLPNSYIPAASATCCGLCLHEHGPTQISAFQSEGRHHLQTPSTASRKASLPTTPRRGCRFWGGACNNERRQADRLHSGQVLVANRRKRRLFMI